MEKHTSNIQSLTINIFCRGIWIQKFVQLWHSICPWITSLKFLVIIPMGTSKCGISSEERTWTLVLDYPRLLLQYALVFIYRGVIVSIPDIVSLK